MKFVLLRRKYLIFAYLVFWYSKMFPVVSSWTPIRGTNAAAPRYQRNMIFEGSQLVPHSSKWNVTAAHACLYCEINYQNERSAQYRAIPGRSKTARARASRHRSHDTQWADVALYIRWILPLSTSTILLIQHSIVHWWFRLLQELKLFERYQGLVLQSDNKSESFWVSS